MPRQKDHKGKKIEPLPTKGADGSYGDSRTKKRPPPGGTDKEKTVSKGATLRGGTKSLYPVHRFGDNATCARKKMLTVTVEARKSIQLLGERLGAAPSPCRTPGSQRQRAGETDRGSVRKGTHLRRWATPKKVMERRMLMLLVRDRPTRKGRPRYFNQGEVRRARRTARAERN